MLGCVLVLVTGCEGVIEGATAVVSAPPVEVNERRPEQPPPQQPDPALPLATELRRLTRTEIAWALQETLGASPPEIFTALPADVGPYDNDATIQRPSAVFVEGWEGIARAVAKDTVKNRRSRLVTCTPRSAGDEACLAEAVRGVGRLLFRRPLSDEEVAELTTLRAVGLLTESFDAALEAVVAALLQDPRFLYRVELGRPDAPDRLTSHEVATRLSFFFWGRPPPAWLLDLADQDGLQRTEQVVEIARRLATDPLATTQIERFHAQWLGYSALPFPAALSASMRAETDAAVARFTAGQEDYLELFRSPESYLDDTLVQHYGLTAPPSPSRRWVAYGSAPRRGILSHGSLLSNGAKQGDTSPTLRGKWVREKLMCQLVPPPPPNSNVDVLPQPVSNSRCKKDRYAAHGQVGACAGCHKAMDPIGFGLENFDQQGRWRTTEAAAPECTIDGKGDIDGVRAFSGTAGLADALVENGALERCVVRQLTQFAIGRPLRADDDRFVTERADEFRSSGRHFTELMIALASSDGFRLRRQ